MLDMRNRSGSQSLRTDRVLKALRCRHPARLLTIRRSDG